MEFIALGALQGDAFVLRSGVTNILIDGGMPSTYGQILEYIDEYTLDAVFVTHVDYDHLGGIFNLVTDEELEISSCDFFMNHPDIPTEYQGEEVGFKHGHSLNSLLKQRGKSFRPIMVEDKFEYGNIKILTLSPDRIIVDALYKNWKTNIIYDDGVLKYKNKQTQTGDVINKSSLILLITCRESNILMLGDSHTETACSSIKKLGYSFEQPLPLNLLKLSHHGSRHNTNEELLKLINCENYYISTNGERYDHPDTSTIQLLQERAAELNTSFNIYINYDIESDIRSKCNFAINNLVFFEQRSLEF